MTHIVYDDLGNLIDEDYYEDLTSDDTGEEEEYFIDEPEEEMEELDFDDEHDQFRDDVEADADVLRSAGFGTDEDYGYYGGDEY